MWCPSVSNDRGYDVIKLPPALNRAFVTGHLTDESGHGLSLVDEACAEEALQRNLDVDVKVVEMQQYERRMLSKIVLQLR